MKSIFTCRRLPNWRFAFPATLSSLIKAFSILFFVSILFYSSKTFSQVAAVNPPTGGFHIDGNLSANTPTPNIGDWLTGAGGTGGFVLSNTGVPVNAATTQLLPKDLYNTTADLIFSGGSKFDGNPNTNWSWTASKPTGKDDINNAMYHVTTDAAGNRWLILGSDRLATTGTSYIDFEFLQKTLTRNPSGGGFTSAGTNGGRTLNDIVISMEYTGGGSTAKVHFYKWQAVGSGFDWVEYKFSIDGGPIPSSSAFGMTNAASTPVPFLAFGLTSYIPYSFVEAAINLTALFGSIDPCLGLNVKTILIKTKASDALTAALKDFVDPIQVTLNFNAPTIDARGPFCADASPVTLTGSPSGGTFSGTGVSGSTFSPSVAGAGTHTITYTYTQNGCNKTATTDIVVNAKPSAPTITSGAATCSAAGSSTISNYSASNTYTFTPSGPSVATGGLISGMTVGTSYTVTSNNGSCTSAASAPFSNAAMLATPATPTITSGAATCSAAGSSTISNYSASNTYAFTPSGPSVATGGLISGMTVGTSYTVTSNNGSCTSAASAPFSNTANLATPATPTITSGAATCSAAGSSTISNYSASNTYTFTPSGPSVATGGLISGMTVGTSYTVTSNNGSCTSAASAPFSNAAMLATPATPTITSGAATCSAAGSSTISNYSASNTYAFTPSGPSVATGGLISGMTVGTSYTVTSNNGSCTSAASAPFSNAANLANPTFTVCVVQPTLCATGSLTINASGGSGFLYTIDGTNPTASNTSNVFNNLGVGSVTTIKVKNSEGCSAAPVNCADIVSNCSAPPIAFNSSPVQITDETTVKAYPNPFNDQVKFVVNAAKSGSGTLDLYNMMGQKVKTVFHGRVQAGVNNFDLSLPGQKSSTLIYRFSMGTKQITGKLLQINQ